jgi:VanZ family protein
MRFIFYCSVFLILYGSLYPFDFSVNALTGAGVERFLYEWSLISSRGDQLGNIALFIPYGFLGILSLGGRRNLAPAILALTVFGLILALWVQVLQLMLPSRDAAMGDVAWNIAGIAVGILIAHPRRVREAVLRQSVGQSQLIVILFLGCWLIVELAPFVPSIDLQSFKDSIKPLWQGSSFSLLAFLRAATAWTMIAYLAVRAFPPRTVWPLLALVMCSTLLAKIIIVDNAITLTDVAAVAVAFFAALGLRKSGTRQSTFLVWLIAGYLIVAGLSPFNFHGSQNFHWIPFTGSLGGSMLLNLQVLAAKVFFISALVYLALECGFRLQRIVVALATSLFALEIAQVWIGNHTPEITDPILASLIGAAFLSLRQNGNAVVRADTISEPAKEQSALPEKAADLRPGVLDHSWLYPNFTNVVVLVIATIALTAAIYTILGLPKIPYNVRELFGGQDSWWRLGFFALAVFSFGIGGTIAGHRVARSRVPWLALPIYSFLACYLTYLLLAACVSSESLSDIAGSSNTYFFVMNHQIRTSSS